MRPISCRTKRRAARFHSLQKEYIWYCRPPRKDSAQPQPSEKASFIGQYPVIYIGNPDEKIIYLTFDDDADDETMNKILDALFAHKACAAFFLNEEYIRKYPKTIRRMVADGHLVCNHTDRHIHMSKVNDFDKFVKELDGVEDAYREATGLELNKFFRPPAGRFSELTLLYARQRGYTTVFWSYSYVDWQQNRQPSLAKAINSILSSTHNGEVILLHTQSVTNLKILSELLQNWESMGFQFGSLQSIHPQAQPVDIGAVS